MKTKKLNKKLILNKETIKHLNPAQMGHNYGGATPSEPPLASCNDFDQTLCAACTTNP